eukprot:CAMPEP_0178927682 /NCGR_PEP_ID=MMETSP0786-20121207/19361_1 /TAXON_ID=186022 /ORGANISM="Thalassionema frauenfeldii, Strain CCMP 1798" /LENGTH=306 /DNA_ID=CAMNT_0020603217 /DNA_START=285 /DNA_END=1202 /DNA_ORIENTATION=-
MQHMDSFRSIESTDSVISYDTPGDKQSLNKGRKKAKWKRRNGKPKRPLSAYNIFFKSERAKLLQAQKKVGFANMAKEISAKWKNLCDEEHKKFAAEAEIEQAKYRAAVKEWKAKNNFELQTHPTPLVPLLSQTDPVILRNLMIQQQMMEQQKLMQEQMHNAIQCSIRRMSMPPIGCISTPECNASAKSVKQCEDHKQEERQDAERRLSLPMHKNDKFEEMPPIEQVATTLEFTNTTYDSTDESSLDDGLADMLINMPIFDDVAESSNNTTRSVVVSESKSEVSEELPEDATSNPLSKLLDRADSLV